MGGASTVFFRLLGASPWPSCFGQGEDERYAIDARSRVGEAVANSVQEEVTNAAIVLEVKSNIGKRGANDRFAN